MFIVGPGYKGRKELRSESLILSRILNQSPGLFYVPM